jgi:beta-glucosidase
MTTVTKYRNPQLAVEDRVQDLLAQMTLDEKVAQLGSVWVYEVLSSVKFDPVKAQALMASGLGQVTRLAGASSLGPGDAAKTANQIQR